MKQITRRKTHKQFVEDISIKFGEEFEVVGKYTLSKNKVKIKHNTCGETFEVIANNFMKRGTCPRCSGYKTAEQFKKQIKDRSGGKYKLKSKYTGMNNPIEVECKIHNITFKRSPKTMMKGSNSCPMCKGELASETQLKPEELFIQELKDRHEGAIVAEDKYKGTHKVIDFRCKICDTVFSTEPNAVLRISGCPTCAEPRGERTIRDYLEINNIQYEPQKRFEECRYIRPLVFDYFLPEYNMLIEYDGMQHYKPIQYFGGEEAFIEQQERDNIKNEFARETGKVLLRIPYTVTGDNIDKELNKVLKTDKLEKLTGK